MNLTVALAAYDRPNYLYRTAAALRHNVDIDRTHVFAFLDACDQAEENRRLLKEFRFPRLSIILRPFRYGCDRHLIQIRRELFEDYEADRVILLEDDVRIGDFALRTLDRALTAGLQTLNVGAVGGYRLCELSWTHKQAALRKLVVANDPWVFYISSQDSWRATRDWLTQYEERFLLTNNTPDLPHAEIWEFFRQHPTAWEPRPRENCGQRALRDSLHQQLEQGVLATGQDAATMLAYLGAGLYRLSLLVNRCEYFGQYGIHSDPQLFTQHGYHRTVLDVFGEDAQLEEFYL